MNKTSIPWTDYTWNPVTGCTKVSEGCANCYAQAMAHRFGWPKGVQLHPERLQEPLRLKKPARVFVCSMSDLFHEDVPFEFIWEVQRVFAQCPEITFQLLTKRPQRMLEFLRWCDQNLIDKMHRSKAYGLYGTFYMPYEFRPNVWLGVTAENQARADERIPLLLQVPAAKHFVSCEPMLGLVRLDLIKQAPGVLYNALWPDHAHLDWVIAGCESGPRRLFAHPDWFRDLRDQCDAAKAPYFLKQMDVDGKVTPEPILDGRQWLEVPA